MISLPTLFSGIWYDDYGFLPAIRGEYSFSAQFDFFRFGTAGKEEGMSLIENGVYPWFMDTEISVRLLRHLACASVVLDYRLFGYCPIAYRIHSNLLYFLLCIAVMLIYRRALTPRSGLLALLLFIVSYGHLMPVMVWMGRHVLLSLLFGLFGLVAHLRWREEKWRPGQMLSILGYVFALLTSEAGMGVLAYVLAYELFGSKEMLKKRILCVLPASTVAVLYLMLYRLGGYGAHNTGLYLNPLVNPIAFLFTASTNLCMYSGAHFLVLPVWAILWFPFLEPYVVVIGGTGLVVILMAIYALWPHIDIKERHALRWLGIGAFFAIIPGLGSTTGTLVMAVSLGIAAIVAIIIVHAWRLLKESNGFAFPVKEKVLIRLLMWSLIMLHVGLASLSWPLQVTFWNNYMERLNALARSIEVDETRASDLQVVVFNAPLPYSAMYPVVWRNFHELPKLKSFWVISAAPFTHRLTRTDQDEIHLEIVEGQMFTTILERVYRRVDSQLNVNDTVKLNGVDITVLATGDQGPTKLLITFQEPMYSDCYQAYIFKENSFQILPTLEIGQTIELHYPPI